MHFPVVAIINIGQRRRDAPFRHDGVRLAEKTFANHAYRHAGRGCFDSCTESRAAGTDYQNIVLESVVVWHGDSQQTAATQAAHHARRPWHKGEHKDR